MGANVLHMPYRRTQFEQGQYYHVFNRAFLKRQIFKGDERKYFIARAVKFSEKFDVSIESFAMMDNHFHFILVQNKTNDGIQEMLYRLQMSFALHFNKKYELSGPVFESRYKAKLIHDDRYYWDVTNYVFKNPIK